MTVHFIDDFSLLQNITGNLTWLICNDWRHSVYASLSMCVDWFLQQTPTKEIAELQSIPIAYFVLICIFLIMREFEKIFKIHYFLLLFSDLPFHILCPFFLIDCVKTLEMFSGYFINYIRYAYLSVCHIF